MYRPLQRASRSQIEARAVPGTGYLRVLDLSFGERPSAVRALLFDGQDFATHVEDAHHYLAYLHPAASAWRELAAGECFDEAFAQGKAFSIAARPTSGSWQV
jgi:hypothetical protein